MYSLLVSLHRATSFTSMRMSKRPNSCIAATKTSNRLILFQHSFRPSDVRPHGQLTPLSVHIVVQSCMRSLTARDFTASATPGLCSTQLRHQSARPSILQFNFLPCCGVTPLAAECSSSPSVVLERLAAKVHMAIFVPAAAAEVVSLIVQR